MIPRTRCNATHGRQNGYRPRPFRRGAASVEFAFVGSLLFTTIFVMFEFGHMNMIRHTVDNAAYEAARHAFVPGGTADDAKERAMSIMNAVGARGATVTVDPPVLAVDSETITVTVSVPLSKNMLVTPRFTDKIIVESSVTLTTERIRSR